MEARKGEEFRTSEERSSTPRGDSLEMQMQMQTQTEERGMTTKEAIGKPPLMNSANVEKCEARLYRERERERRWADCWERDTETEMEMPRDV